MITIPCEAVLMTDWQLEEWERQAERPERHLFAFDVVRLDAVNCAGYVLGLDEASIAYVMGWRSGREIAQAQLEDMQP